MNTDQASSTNKSGSDEGVLVGNANTQDSSTAEAKGTLANEEDREYREKG